MYTTQYMPVLTPPPDRSLSTHGRQSHKSSCISARQAATCGRSRQMRSPGALPGSQPVQPTRICLAHDSLLLSVPSPTSHRCQSFPRRQARERRSTSCKHTNMRAIMSRTRTCLALLPTEWLQIRNKKETSIRVCWHQLLARRSWHRCFLFFFFLLFLWCVPLQQDI